LNDARWKFAISEFRAWELDEAGRSTGLKNKDGALLGRDSVSKKTQAKACSDRRKTRLHSSGGLMVK
jgi:hypothetical protein